MQTRIGEKTLLEKTPKMVKIGEKNWILSRNLNGEPVVYDTICPHQSGIVSEISKDCLRCPNHGWIFQPKSGKCINAPQAHLQSYKVEIKEDSLFAELPIIQENRESTSIKTKIIPKISVVGSASLLIEWDDFRILTDPWLEGPALWGSWINYPPSEMTVSKLPEIDLIWISHEHPDHLHEPTLSLLDKNIPIYVPAFSNQRLSRIIKKIGFKNITSMESMKPIKINEDLEITTFYSASIWYDSMLLIHAHDYTILNVNDAGFNWKISELVGKVDIVCSSFSQGASGYPLTWTHIDEPEKNRIQNRGNTGMLKMLEQIVNAVDAEYLIPMASYNELGLPEHLEFEKKRIKNTPFTVKDYFKEKSVTVLDILPGESWGGQDKEKIEHSDRNKFYDKDFLYNYLKKYHESPELRKYTPTKFDISHQEIKNYFEKISNSQITKEIGKMRIAFTLKENNRTLHSKITFNQGQVKYESIDEPEKDVELTMICPGGIVQDIIEKDLSWDALFAGMWCKFSRNPDEYNIALWKFFHIPWEARPEYHEKEDGMYSIKKNTAIATLVEIGGEEVTNTLEKYGMFCTGCEISIGETLEEGCRLHSMPTEKMNELIFEIESIIKKKAEEKSKYLSSM